MGEYNKSKYHLKDVIVGKIYFLLVRIKIRHMEVAIIKRETTGAGPNTFHDNETIAKYEIMDGAPVKGESIPIRVFLAGYDLTPTMRDINKKFSVRYYLNLVLVDEEDRRYFKQQEITLWRKGDPRNRKGQQMPPSGLPVSAYQVPHAMARHNPGDYPSANVRTAPTPSEPNTPIAEPGFTVPNTFAQQQPQYPPPLQEEEGEEPPAPEVKNSQPPQIKEVLKEQLPEEVPPAKKIEPAASFPAETTTSAVPESLGKVPEQTATPVAESNQTTPKTEPEGVAAPQISRKIEEEKSNHKTENSIGEEENIKKTVVPESLGKVPEQTATPPKAETIKNDSSETKEIEEKMSNLNTTKTENQDMPPKLDDNVKGVVATSDIEDT